VALSRTNLLLYLMAVLLVWQVLRLWLKDERWAVAGALLFAVHPMHIESVTFVSGRTDLMARSSSSRRSGSVRELDAGPRGVWPGLRGSTSWHCFPRRQRCC